MNVTLKGGVELTKKVAKTDRAGNCAAKNVIYFAITLYVFFYNSISPFLYLVDSDNIKEKQEKLITKGICGSEKAT